MIEHKITQDLKISIEKATRISLLTKDDEKVLNAVINKYYKSGCSATLTEDEFRTILALEVLHDTVFLNIKLDI